MSIEDAAILARAIDEVEGPMETRLKAYEQARKKRVARVVGRARQNGRIYHMRGPLAMARNLTMQMMPANQLVKQFDWIYGWNPEKVSFAHR